VIDEDPPQGLGGEPNDVRLVLPRGRIALEASRPRRTRDQNRNPGPKLAS
jgi:hypothetical protein